MNTILTLTERDVYPENIITPEDQYAETRNAVRVVIFDEQDNVAFDTFPGQHGEKRYSTIGGGIDPGETVEEALLRECLEEAGCNIKNIQALGLIEERGIGNKKDKCCIQINHCFIAEIDGSKMEPQMTEEEVREGHGCIWLPLDAAISEMKNQPNTFITRRTLFLLEEAKKVRGL